MTTKKPLSMRQVIAIAILELAAGAFVAVLWVDLSKGACWFISMWGATTAVLAAILWACDTLQKGNEG